MTTLAARHSVADYDAWKSSAAAFLADWSLREAHTLGGVQGTPEGAMYSEVEQVRY